MSNYHVSKKGDGWQAKKEKAQRPAVIVPTQKEGRGEIPARLQHQ